jgi:DNA topoisomerase IA
LGEVESIEFKATGKQILEPGWRIIFGIPSARRFIAVFYPDCKFATTTVLGEVESIEFKATGKQILEPGCVLSSAPPRYNRRRRKRRREKRRMCFRLL